MNVPSRATRRAAPSSEASVAEAVVDNETEVRVGDVDRDSSLRVLRPRRASPDRLVRPTRAEVDLDSLRHNLRVLARAAGSARVWGVLKADAYGHGAPGVARTLERAGIDGLAVALLEEAIELRDAGIRAPVLVMGGYYGRSYEELLVHDLVPVVYDASHFEGLSRCIRANKGLAGTIEVHLKIDTGMSRLGVIPSELSKILDVAARFPEVVIDGVMTHLASADHDGNDGDEAIAGQMKAFDASLAVLRARGISPRYVHAANSAATLRAAARPADATATAPHPSDARRDAVRPGIALFGVSPFGQNMRASIDARARDDATGAIGTLRPTLMLRSEVVALRTLQKGAFVGYGSTWIARRESTIATVPVGYADGLPRALSNCGHMIVRGKRVPIVGALSMDLATLDVTDVPGVRLRDEVVALGTQRGPLGVDTISVEEISAAAGIIPWDVLTSISRRVPRFYRDP